eukprot:522912-Amorphochlora_amoeboformis.AAC.1
MGRREKKGGDDEPFIVLQNGSYDIKRIDFKVFDERLPVDGSPEGNEILRDIFRGGDANGNGMLSIAELEKLLMITLRFEKPVKIAIAKSIRRAFDLAKGAEGKNSSFIEIHEFPTFCRYLRRDLRVLKIYKAIDTSGDMRMDLPEFK